MKSFAVAMTAVAALSSLVACGDTDGSLQAGALTAGATASTARLDEGRFRVLLDDTADLLDRIEAVGTDTVPSGPDEANRMLGVDDASPLRFAELVQTGQHSGRWCLASDDDTYLAFDGSHDGALAVFLGDGVCAYTADHAEVVGNLVNGKWVKGADLMGAAALGDVFPVDRMSAEGPGGGTEVAPEPVGSQLLLDLSALAFAVAQYADEHHEFPAVPADRLVEKLADGTHDFSSQTRVFAYRHGPAGFALCLVDGRGHWLRWNRLGQISNGTYTSADDLAECAAPLLADDAD